MAKYTILLVLLMTALLLVGCGDKKDDAAAWNEQAASTAQSTQQAPADVSHDHAAHAGVPGGKVLETMDSGGYTYARLETADGETWAAGPVTALEIGSEVELANAMKMHNFKATSLDRTFDEIWFASGFSAPGEVEGGIIDRELQNAHGDLSTGGADVDFSGLSAPTDGITVAQLYADMASLAGHRVKLRGKVVKYNAGIMGRNWLHLQDGSGDAAAGDHDITITTDSSVNIGDTVLIDGVLAVDKDFGSGYFYKAIVEEAKVTVESDM